MKKVTDTLLLPAYLPRFTCIAGDCEDTCCAGWNIPLDKASFLRYQASIDPLLRPLISQFVKKNPKSTRANEYAQISLRDDDCRSCGFLSEQKLCRIQERLGGEALSEVCSLYPRTIHRCQGLGRMTLTLSCPEAARQALLHEDAFEFVGQVQTLPQSAMIEILPHFGFAMEGIDEVQALTIQLLRSPETPLSRRLMLVGLLCEGLVELARAKRPADLPVFLSSFERSLDDGSAMARLSGFYTDTEIQAQVSEAFFRIGWNTYPLSPHSRKVWLEITEGLGLSGGSLAMLVPRYEEGLRKLEPALAAVPWLLEHFVLNEALREFFPWGSTHPKQHYATLVFRFVMVRLMLAGRAVGREAPLTPEELAETVQVACRRYAHDRNNPKNVDRFMAEKDWESLDRLFALL